MLIIQDIGLERKLKAYKVLLPNMKNLHKLWRISVQQKIYYNVKPNLTVRSWNVRKKKRKIKQILFDTINNNSIFAIRYKQE